jgi:lipoprotein-anchoring transpeptidase ErfK/SrfK
VKATTALLARIGLACAVWCGSESAFAADGLTIPLHPFPAFMRTPALATTANEAAAKAAIPAPAKSASIRTNENIGPASRPNRATETITLTSQLAPQEIAQLADRLKAGLTQELRENFDLFVYVSKAEEGPWAQHMYVFVKERSADTDPKWILLENWAVSTGREAMEQAKNGERMSTETPAGVYQLDPDRFFVEYRSSQWRRDMPNSMFFNWMSGGNPTGLAIHGVADADQIAALGRRASAGCVQLPLDASQKLFDLVRDNFEGEVPRFAYDQKTRTINNKGELARDENGDLVMASGYRALVVIEDYGGPEQRTSKLDVDSPGPAG